MENAKFDGESLLSNVFYKYTVPPTFVTALSLIMTSLVYLPHHEPNPMALRIGLLRTRAACQVWATF